MGAIVFLVLVGLCCIVGYHFWKRYDENREKLVMDAINGRTSVDLLRTGNAPRQYNIIYRNRDCEIQSHMVEATNDMEATCLFVKDMGESIMRISTIESCTRL